MLRSSLTVDSQRCSIDFSGAPRAPRVRSSLVADDQRCIQLQIATRSPLKLRPSVAAYCQRYAVVIRDTSADVVVAILGGRHERPTRPPRTRGSSPARSLLRSLAGRERPALRPAGRMTYSLLALRASLVAGGQRCGLHQRQPDVASAVAIHAGRSRPALPIVLTPDPSVLPGLRSSLAANGQRCRQTPRARTAPRDSCDPHMPRTAGLRPQQIRQQLHCDVAILAGRGQPALPTSVHHSLIGLLAAILAGRGRLALPR